MVYRPRSACRRCGLARGLAGGLSRSGLCSECGPALLADNLRQLAAKSGPNWERYRDGMTGYVVSLWGGTNIPDTLPAQFDQLSLLEMNQS